MRETQGRRYQPSDVVDFVIVGSGAAAESPVGGPWDGLHVVTKGGLIGDADTAVLCMEHLRRAVERDRRHVTSAEPRTRW